MNIRFYLNEDFEVYQTGAKSFSLAYHEAGVAAIFDSYESAVLASKKDLNAVEALWLTKCPVELSVEDLESLDN